MKTQITLCLLLVMLVSPPGRFCRLSPDSPPAGFISLIDRYWESGDYFYLKLPEIEGTLYFNRLEFPAYIKSIESAYTYGLPLRFGHEGQHIISVHLPKIPEIKAYLATYSCVGKLDIDSVRLRCEPLHTCYSYAYYRKRFFTFLEDSFGIHQQIYPLHYGCEARAGVIAKFLGQYVKTRNYKLFIDGRIHYACKNNMYNWVSHALNIIPVRRSNKTELLVFDPFSLENWISLEDFLKKLADNGSSGLSYYLTNPDVFVSYSKYDKGVLDKEFQYSKTIFKNICRN